MAKLTPREAIARIFPDHDRQMAARAIAWLDQCGYQIVNKEQVSIVPPGPANEDRQQTRNFNDLDLRPQPAGVVK